MFSRKRLLYFTYTFLKKIGYIRLVNRLFNYANIMCFHRVNHYDTSPLTVSTALFEEIVREINKHYRAISLQTLVRKIHNKEILDPNTVVITFDDGYRDNFLYAAPILKKYNVPATFFVTSGYINTNRIYSWDESSMVKHPIMDWDDVRELCRMGFDIGSHTVNHVNLGKVPVSEAKSEIFDAKVQIESQIHQEVNTFAIPFGRRECINGDVKPLVQAAGFSCCCLAHGGKVSRNSDLFGLYRVPIYPSYIEMMMEIDNFMTFYENKMKINILRRELYS